MCGIAGFRRGDQDDAAVAGQLLACLSTRGPEGDAWARADEWVLAHTRLAIIDLSERVRYPLANEARNVWLTFNGEIYNFRDLRRELEARGHTFTTACDAEVIVHGWEEWRLDLLPMLSGMFAFGLVDERTSELVVARDRLGIKPLCVTTGDRFAFASDAMALVAAGLAPAVADQEAITEFLAFHYVPPPRTGILGLEHVEPGTAVIATRSGREVQRWAPLPFVERDPVPADGVTLEELDAALGRAVERHVVADVEVGLMLSSGIDSQLLLERLASAGRPPVCFTVGFKGAGDYDESASAAEVAQRYGAEHHVDELDIGFAEAVKGVAEAFDGPFADASAVPTLSVARLASTRVKVVLSGTGGDDLFAGYYRHRAHLLRRIMRTIPEPALRALAALPVTRGGERVSTIGLLASYAARLARARGSDSRAQYLSLVGTSTSARALELVQRVDDVRAAPRTVAKRIGLTGSSIERWLHDVQAFECRTYLPYDLLVKEDRATMAHSVESRVPLLDLELLALAERMPSRQLISLRSGKRPLRTLAARRIGRASAVKRGFATPLGPLLSGSWRDECTEWLQASGSANVDGRAVAAALRAGNLQPSDVWALSTLLAWEQRLGAAGARRAVVEKHRPIAEQPPI